MRADRWDQWEDRMMKPYMTLTALAGGLAAACAAQQPVFDAVSVKAVDVATPPPLGATGGPGTDDPGRIHFGRAPMLELLRRAYDVNADQVVGPSWIQGDFTGTNTYTIDATMPPSTTKEQFRLMLQNMLAERFHLVVHHETHDFPGYDLVLAKGGPKFKEAIPPPAREASRPNRALMGNDGFPVLPPGPQTSLVQIPGVQRVKYQERSMAEFAYNLGFRIALGTGPAVDLGAKRPRVRDMTGLTGRYDFILEYSCETCIRGGILASRPAPDGSAAVCPTEPVGGGAAGIFEAVEKQLGLKLVKVKDVPVDVIVIDRVDKVPTAN